MKFSACGTYRKISFLLCVLFVVFFEGKVFSKPGRNAFNWQQQWRFLTRVYQDTAQSSPYEKHQDIDARLWWSNKVKFDAGRYIVDVGLEGRYKLLTGKNTEKDFDLLLRDAYFESHQNNYSIRIGRQIITWGKLDGVMIMDRISPQDFSRFVLMDKQERKDPVFALRYDFYGAEFQAEAVYLPFFKPSYVRFFGSDWAVFGHLKEIVANGSYTPAVKSAIAGIQTENKNAHTQRAFNNGELGLRFQGHTDKYDYSFYYMNIHSRIPVLREKTPKGNVLKKFLYLPGSGNLADLMAVDPQGDDLILEREHPRVDIIGGDFETTAGSYGIRGEGGLFLGMPYLREDFSYVKKDNIIAGVGLDHTTSRGFYYNIQFIETIILNYKPLFAREEYSHQLTAKLKKEFLRGNILLELDFVYNLSYGDRMFNPQLTYKFNNGLDIAVGGFVFQGALTTLFGRYNDKDLVYLQVGHRF